VVLEIGKLKIIFILADVVVSVGESGEWEETLICRLPLLHPYAERLALSEAEGSRGAAPCPMPQ
jgi:hypothetical protein